MRIKISLSIICTTVAYMICTPLSAGIAVVNYACSDNRTLTVSYFLGNATKNATTVFENVPHKMYYDPTSSRAVMVFREEPYSLHVENKDDLTEATVINITKESQGKMLHDSVLYKNCLPQ